MVNTTLHNVAKHSLLYGYVLSQPFATYVEAYPGLESETLIDTEQFASGEHGVHVRDVQKKLANVQMYLDQSEGYYGVVTESAVKTFQMQQQFMKQGGTDRITVDRLVEINKERYIEQIEQLSHAIEPGMHNEDVEVVQTALAYFGYYEGTIDGIYGPLTKQALQQAELRHDVELITDAVVNPVAAVHEEVEEQQVEPLVEEKVEKVEDVQQASTPPIQIETTPSNGDLIQVAHSYIGTPYAWGGTSPNGFDCSGFIQFVFAQENKTIPRTVNEIWNFSTPVDQPSVGDIVFFETYKAGASHAGIYVGDGKFIHAGESRGVEVANLDQDYWKQRYLGAQRIQ